METLQLTNALRLAPQLQIIMLTIPQGCVFPSVPSHNQHSQIDSQGGVSSTVQYQLLPLQTIKPDPVSRFVLTMCLTGLMLTIPR